MSLYSVPRAHLVAASPPLPILVLWSRLSLHPSAEKYQCYSEKLENLNSGNSKYPLNSNLILNTN